MEAPKPNESIISPCGVDDSSCGYCHNGSNPTLYISPLRLACIDYQDMMDRGFRRSGKIVYKLLPGGCCTAHTIRLDAFSFQMTKSQKKVLRHLATYLKKPSAESELATSGKAESDAASTSTKESIEAIDKSEKIIPQQSAKGQKKTAVGESSQKHGPSDYSEQRNHYFEWMMKDPENKKSFTVSASLASFSDEKFQLYNKYQTTVHKDPPGKNSPSSFRSFLIDTCLKPSQTDSGLDLGTFHLEYRIDGKLIAVSVLDVVPTTLSSVYFFYDPDFDFLSLGKVSALYDIEWIRTLNKTHPTIRYYYLGYYIATCAKMRYKGEYKPSDLLCPKTYRWVPLESVSDQVDKDPTEPLCKENIEAPSIESLISKARFLSRNTPTNIAAFPRQYHSSIIQYFDEILRHLGPDLASSCWLRLN
eukprot:TRINITY_DN10711_c0_g1_i3.p1 TRINITY_DN10711_c0_g1~~TRINITY_DN10711_c0_g1_i3.p1  ORF type:complete len:418 (+),score=70.67 TRINITY_DN10711_c0_g1_i3:50-1303(+)